MSAPFGEHPTLGQYIAWASGVGCTVSHGVTGNAQSIVEITALDGKGYVSVVGLQHDTHLAPTMVSRLDRRLGLKSPFASLPGG